MPNYNYAEGGGRLPPFRESFLERIVDVSWQSTGAIFVSGDFCCFQRAVRLERFDSQQDWVGLGPLGFDPNGGTFASSYAVVDGKPLFLIGGHRGRDGNGIVMVSNDGFNWKMGHVFLEGEIASYVSSLVWDADPREPTAPGQGLFYANLGVGSSSTPDKLGITRYSPDGILWFVSGTSFADHCKIISGVPDGVFGYDPKQDLLIFPGESSVPNIGDIFYKPNGLLYDPTLIYIITDASTKFARIFPMTLSGTVQLDDTGTATDWVVTDCIAVAYCGGIWMVGGGGNVGKDHFTTITVSSIDNGFSWFLSTYGNIGASINDFYIETMIGAPIRDFSNQPAVSAPTAAVQTTEQPVLLADLPVKTGKKRPPS